VANQTVGTSAAELSGGRIAGVVFVQNLGPGALYIDADPAVASTTGVKLAVNATWQSPEPVAVVGGHLYIIADQAATDVRYLVT
jgi:hypothetical protein